MSLGWLAVAASVLAGCMSILFTPQGQGVLVYLNFPAFLWFPFDTPGQPHVLGFPGLLHTSNHYIPSTDNVTLGAWYTQAQPKADKLVLYLHGNGEHRGMSVGVRKHTMYPHPPFHADVFSVDYRGFGDSTFVWPTEQGLYDDAHAAFAFAATSLGFQPHQVVVHGYSLGSAVATRLVHDLCLHSTCPAGLLLEAPFLSIGDMVAEMVKVQVPSSLLHHHFPTKAILGSIPVPIWIVHGSLDSVVPYRHGTSLATMFAHSTMGFCPVTGATHMTSFAFRDAHNCVADTFWPHVWRHCYQQPAATRFRRLVLQESPFDRMPRASLSKK